MNQLEQYAVLDCFPEPVLLAADGLVAYCNAAAAAVFHGIKADVPLPIPLDECVPGTACSLSVQGEAYGVTAMQQTDGVLFVLRRMNTGFAPGMDALSAHLRQTLGTLTAAAQALMLAGDEARADEAEPDAQSVLRYKGTLNQSIYRMTNILEQLEKLGELDAHDGTAYRPAAMDLAGLCAGVMRGVEGLAALSDVQTVYESKLVSLITTGDAALLERMLLALLSNAIKASAPGGRVGLRLTKSGSRARITVWDEGTGLDEGDLSAIFSGVPSGLPKAGAGLGLGLSIVRRIIALHGGTMMADTHVGGGLRATVSLPIGVPTGGVLRASLPGFEDGGFSPLLVQLADALPWQAFLPGDVD